MDWIPGKKKNISRKTGETGINLVVNSTVQCQFLTFDNYTMAM